MAPLLALTSCGFFIPAILGFIGGRIVDASAIGILGVLSIWNHGMRVPMASKIDRAYAHAFGVRYGIRILYLSGTPWNWLIRLLFCTGIACYAFERGHIQPKIHCIVHMTVIVAFSIHMLDGLTFAKE